MQRNSQINSQQIDSKIRTFIARCQDVKLTEYKNHPDNRYSLSANRCQFSQSDAGVMVLLQQQPQWQFVLTQKAQHLNKHAGQVAFPGGKFDSSDLHILNTAYRETFEEIGIDANLIQPFYSVKPIMSRYNVKVHSFLALLDKNAVYKPDMKEVSHTFTVPIKYLVQTPLQHKIVEHNLEAPAWEVGNFMIWGFTAGVINHLLHIIFGVKNSSAFDFRFIKN